MARDLSEGFERPQPEHRDSEDLLRCGWNRTTNHRCRLPASIKPQGESHHLCRWHANLMLFSDPKFSQNREEFIKWLEVKRPTWIPVCTADVWLRPADELFRLACGH